MILLFIGCLSRSDLAGDSDRPLDPTPEMGTAPNLQIDDFQSSEVEYDVNIPEQEESILSLSVEEYILYTQHQDVLLPCDSVFLNEVFIHNATITIQYTEDNTDDCYSLYNLEYEIDLSPLEEGTYILRAADSQTEFELSE